MSNYDYSQEENESPFYENPKRTNTGNDGKNKVVFSEKNYLNVRLAPNEKSRIVKIRILPIKPGTNKIALPISIHSLKVDKQIAASGFKTFLCLNDEHLSLHDDRGCPICNKSKEYFDMANEVPKNDPHAEEKRKSLCKEAFKFQPKTAYIVRVIERGKEEEGVKFWRFNHWDNGKGCKDQLENLYNLRKTESEEAGEGSYNIFDLYNGRDINLTLTKSENENSRTEKTEITITDAGIRTPLSKNETQIEEWVNDTKDWRDMYSCKDFQYLEIVADGGIPVYSTEKRGYVTKEEKEKNDAAAEQEAVNEIRNGAPQEVLENNSVNDVDLPF